MRESERLKSGSWTEGLELPPSLDARFQETPWGDWTGATQRLANDRVAELLDGREELDLVAILEDGEAFSPSDPRFTLQGTVVRRRGSLRRKVLAEVPQDEQFQRYLPLLELEVLGSANPTTDLRSQVAEDVPVLGWVDTLGADKPPNDRQFVVRLRGDSMEGGKRPLVDGAWLILELTEAVDNGTVTAVQLNHTGSYSVVLKRLFDEDTQLRLVSQNPNYEDTVFEADAADDVKVVARFIQELPPPQRTRTAKPDNLKDWLKKRLTVPPVPPETPDLPAQLDGVSQLVLTDKGMIWVLRVEPLPPFVDEVTLAEVPFDADLIRGRVARLPTSPSTDTYALQAGPLTPLLQPFEHPGLADDRATVFRFDSNGHAVRKLGPYVRIGERVRLLLPPGMQAPSTALQWEVGTWTACELEVRADLPPELGLEVSTERIEAFWETGPQRWHRLPDGRRMPEFSVDQQPILRVRGIVATRRGEFSVTTLSNSHALPKGSSWSIALQDSHVGEHAIEITPASTALAFVRRALAVSENEPPYVSPDIAVEPSKAADLREWPLVVRGPALWSVEATWQGSRTVSRQLTVGADGLLPLDALEIDTRMLRREPMGILTLDFGELGRRVVQHRRVENPADLAAAVEPFVENAPQADPLLVEKLAERLLTAFGWTIEGGVVHRPTLVADELTHEPVAVLCVGTQLDEELKSTATQACRDQGLQLGFVVAGTTWLHHAPDALFPDEPIDLAEDRAGFMKRFHWSTR